MSDDLGRLVSDLNQVARVSPKAAREILQETAEPAKQHWKQAASTGRSASRYARQITFNTYQLPAGAEGEIGARTGGAGSLGILDDPLASVRSNPSRARRSASKFIQGEFDKRGKTVVDRTLRDSGL